ncbi:hypothetical protein KGQ71_00695 [Patescibacteria group bacterium]|nr:hypothetical protein [Patescibacteria group bacterium]
MSARYSHQAGYSIARRKSQRATMRTVRRRVRFGPTTAKFIGLAVLAILAIVMLTMQAGTNATGVYQQNSLNKNISQVDEDTTQLQLNATRAQALNAIQQTAVKDQMAPTGSVNGYVENGTVAGVSTQKP